MGKFKMIVAEFSSLFEKELNEFLEKNPEYIISPIQPQGKASYYCIMLERVVNEIGTTTIKE